MSGAGILIFDVVIGVFLFLAPSCIIVRWLAPEFSLPEQILVSVPVSFSLVAIFATWVSLINIPFCFFTWGIFAVIVIAGGCAYAYRNQDRLSLRPVRDELTFDTRDAGCSLLLLVSILITLGVLLIGFQGFLVPPHNDDGSVHNRIIAELFEKQNVYQVFSNSLYPYGFHVTAALLMGIIPVPGYRLSFYLVIVVAALVPAALYFFCVKMYHHRETAAFAALLSIGSYLFPFAPFGWGGHPLILGFFCVPFVFAISWLSLKEDDLRLAVLSGILVAGTFFIHPSEIIPESVFLIVIILFLVHQKTPLRSLWKNILILAITAGIFVAASLRSFLGFLNIGMALGTTPVVNVLGDPVSLQYALIRSLGVFNLRYNVILLGCYIAGLVYLLHKREYLEILAVQIFFYAIYLDVSTLRLLNPVYIVVQPWSQYERLLYLQYFFVMVIAGAGLSYLVTYLGRRNIFHLQGIRDFAILGVVVIVLSLPSLVMTAATLHTLMVTNVAVTPDDMAAMEWIGDNIPKNATILNDDGNDAGVWIPGVSYRDVLIPDGGATPDKLYLARHIAEVPNDEKATALLGSYHITYLYYGARVLPGRERMFPLTDLQKNPHFSVMYQSGSAYLFRYNGNLTPAAPD